MSESVKKSTFHILQIATVAVFAGRAYQHLFKDAPYREIIWDPAWTGWAVNLFSNLSWDEFVTHPLGDVWIQKFVFGMGLFYLACAIATLLIGKLPKWGRGILLIGASGLALLAAVYAKDRFFQIGQFFEYSLQFGSSILLYYFLKEGSAGGKLIFMAKIATAVAFTCHGLYALGYYPYPGSFMTMTQNILGLSVPDTLLFLNIAGILDFVVAIGIFLPKKWGRFALVYCVFWGFVTSMARIVGNFYWEYPLESLHQWVYEAVYRAPHFLIPLWILLVQKKD